MSVGDLHRRLASSKVKLKDVTPGETYYAVYTRTGVCIGRYRTRDEAETIVNKDPDSRELMAHTKH